MKISNKIAGALSTLCVGLIIYGVYQEGKYSTFPNTDEVNKIKESLKAENPKDYIKFEDISNNYGPAQKEKYWQLKCDSIIKARDSIKISKAGYELGRQSIKVSEGDSLRIAQRAYALGVQAVQDSLKKVGKRIK